MNNNESNYDIIQNNNYEQNNDYNNQTASDNNVNNSNMNNINLNKDNKNWLIILIIFIIVLILGVILLLNSSKKNNQNNLTDETTSSNEVDNQNNSESNNQNDKYDYTINDVFKITGHKIYVNVPDRYFNDVEYGYSQLFTYGDEYAVTVTGIDEQYDDLTLDNAFEKCERSYKNSLMSHARIGDISITKKEEVTINGIPMIRITGTYPSDDYIGTNLYTVGYLFVYDGIPCSIRGIVFKQEQPEEYIAAITKLVDKMIYTVRDTK